MDTPPVCKTEPGQQACALCCEHFDPSENGSKVANLGKKLIELFPFNWGDDGDASEKLKLLACANCVTFVTSALENRKRVSGKEEQVRKAQLLILKMKRKVVKMLRELEGAIGEFKEVVGGLEGVLEESKDKVGVLEEALGENKGESGEGLLVDAILFREKVLQLMEELSIFGSKGQDKQLQPENEEVPSGRPKRRRAKKRKYGEEAYQAPDVIDPDNPDHVEIKYIPANGVINDQEDNCEDNEPDYAPDVDMSLDGRPGDGDEGSEWEESEDEKRKKSRPMPRSKKRVKNRKITYKSIQSKFDISGMSRFKKDLLSKVVRFSVDPNKAPKTSGSSSFDAIDPTRLNPLTYDPTTDKLLMGGIQIAINESKKCYQCLECGTELPTDRRRKLYNHVLGFHLNLFQCPHCPFISKDIDGFKVHISGHEGKYDCNVCGKPLQRGESLKAHRWTHMSQEEKEQALQNGEKGGHNYLSRVNKPKGVYICVTCGKGPFATPWGLRCHEKSHQDQDKDPEFICPQCGKEYKAKTSLQHHQRYYCFQDKNSVEKQIAWRHECNLCLKRFPLAFKLKEHKLSAHGENKQLKCHYCEKVFKSEKDRTKHEKQQHLECTRYKCGNGCGAAFGRSDAAKKHEESCGGGGRVRGGNKKVKVDTGDFEVGSSASSSYFENYQ